MSLIDHYQRLKQNIPQHVQLLVVSKKQSIADIETLYHLGQRDFGENRIQELSEKNQLTMHLSELRWHMIGQIQSNKIRKLLSINRLVAIHSVDRLKLIDDLIKNQDCIKQKTKIALFWEINLSKDKSKHGFTEIAELRKSLEVAPLLEKFYYQGLMCMGPLEDDTSLTKTKIVFQEMQLLKNLWQKELSAIFINGLQLSMGMSHDYVEAIRFGSNCVRIGSSIFNKD